MKNVLVVNTSINGDASQSNILIGFARELIEKNSEALINTRDLGNEPLPHLSQAEMTTWRAELNELNDDQKALREYSDTLIAELELADTIIVGLPMYNFDSPSNFKAWIDRICRAGRTFSYTENGPVGLLDKKNIIIVATRGGKYAGTELDTQTSYIKNVFAFIGQADLTFIYAEGLAMSEAETSMAQAKEQLTALFK